MNKNLTWNQLAKIIDEMPPERRADNVSIYDFAQDEYLSATKVKITNETDVLDKGARFLTTE